MRRMLGTTLMAALAAAVAGSQATEAATISVTADITASETWTNNNDYILTKPIYVTNGATLTIQPGTVIRGESESSAGANDPGTLVITRGSKIQAVGTKENPIVFTDLFDDNVRKSPGTFPYDRLENTLGQVEQWGGVVILGRTYVANNTLAAPLASREVQIEGLTAAGNLGFYGNGGNDDDDSGEMRYVSIRYGGFNLSANNEINGLTLGAVGRGTDLDYIETFQNKDDGTEFFGGTVGVKHLISANGGDDGVDYDEGFRGKLQFVLVLQGTPGADKSDKGAEQDGGNSPDGSQPFATPMIYNATYIGLGQKAYTNRLQNTALHFRDNAGGRYNNSFFADFGGATMCIEGATSPGSATGANTSGERAITPYVVDPLLFPGPDSDFQLDLQDNTFWCFGNGSTVPAGDASAFGCDAGKNHYDNGAFTNAALDNAYLSCAAALPILGLTRTDNGDATTPDPITFLDPRPAPGSPLLTTNNKPPVDGFFEPAAYRGAFSPVRNWASGWTSLARTGYFPTCASTGTAVPDEVESLAYDLVAGTPTMLWWTTPAAEGGETYDLVRSRSASDWSLSTCVESNTPAYSAIDGGVPAVNEAFYYVVVETNACGRGSSGMASDGTVRAVPDC